MTNITRRLEFDAGHRVLGHEGKCRNLHGHRYVAEVAVTAADLDKLGRVVDFSVVKHRVGKWIDDNWDHNLLLHPDDPVLQHDLNKVRYLVGRRPYVFPEGLNPTAENMAHVLFNVAKRMLQSDGLTVLCVRMYETPNCWADYPRS